MPARSAPQLSQARRSAGLRLLGPAGLLAALLAGGCAPDRVVTGSITPVDYRERHPIVLTDGPRVLDLFVNAPGGLDARQRADVRAFAAEYRRHAQGGIVAHLPRGSRTDAAAIRLLEQARAILAESGVPDGFVTAAAYPAVDPALAAPVRLTFRRLQAKVASQCGQWPSDLGVSDGPSDWSNEPYWNLGCATQSNVAAQIADPVDLVRGRAETRIDTLKRMRDIESLRQGKDPSTEYRQDRQNRISTAVGN